MDWNWFFGAMAQSGAAIVGIVSAFVIYKLFGINERMDRLIDQYRVMEQEYRDLKFRIQKRYFHWYNQGVMFQNQFIIEALNKGEFHGLKDDEILKKLYETAGFYKDDDHIIHFFRDLINKYYKKTEDGAYQKNDVAYKQDANDIDLIFREKASIEAVELASRNLITRFRLNSSSIDSLKKEINIQKIVIWILGVSLLVCVIYPLHFIPLSIDSSPQISFNFSQIFYSLNGIKTILLSLFTIIILTAPVYFYFLLKNHLKTIMKFQSELVQKKHHIEISQYSSYFDTEPREINR